MTTDMFDFEREMPVFEPKVWGDVVHVFDHTDVAISVLRVNKGFRCSRHLHRHRANIFRVISGMIQVCEWDNENTIRLFPHQPTWLHTMTRASVELVVAPNRPHMFRVLESGLVVEIYTSVDGPVDIKDIVRFDEGGLDDFPIHNSAGR